MPNLPSIRTAFPGYEVTEDRRRTPPRFAAVARDLSSSPYAIVTDDLGELARILAQGKDTAA